MEIFPKQDNIIILNLAVHDNKSGVPLLKDVAENLAETVNKTTSTVSVQTLASIVGSSANNSKNVTASQLLEKVS